MEFTEISSILFGVTTLLVIYICMTLHKKHQFWLQRNIPHDKPLPIIGNLLQVLLLKKSVRDIHNETYFKFPNSRLAGVYEFYKPTLIVRDPELIEKILIKDFLCFTDHPQISEEGGIFAKALFQLTGKRWRSVRQKVSAGFTSGKLKNMFEDMVNRSEVMVEVINKNLNCDYKIRNAISIFVIEILTNSVFGMKISNENARDELIEMSSSVFNNLNLFRFIHVFMLQQFPKLAEILKLKLIAKNTTAYFNKLISYALKERTNDGRKYDDFMQFLVKLRERDIVEINDGATGDDGLGSTALNERFEFTDDLLTGQAFQFYSAGFEPIVITLLFVLTDLAVNPEIQERARDHIKDILEKHNGCYTYDSIKDMTYLEQCIQESLRINSVALAIFRECTKDYYIPEEELKIQKGMQVIIPMNALQMDPKYYPDPEIYNPDRLPPKCTRRNFTYLPFGDGPRICIGIKYAMVVIKLGLAKILANYKLTLSPKMQYPLVMNKFSAIQAPKSEILMNITRI